MKTFSRNFVTHEHATIVCFDAATESGKDTYYGYTVDIWELDSGPDFKVPLFKCKWVNLLGGGVQVDPQ